ncbi:MAG: trimeric intracellular cation channel family protein [Pseudoalteromonas marina]
MTELYHWFDLIGIAVFAISGTLVAYEKTMDGFGVVVLATVTAIGGGTVRDVILDVPVFWLHDQSYFFAILAAVLITSRLINKQKSIPYYTLQIADAFGLAFFAVMGTQKALLAGMPEMTAIIMGVITACFGGLIRDVLAREIPMLLKGELYAITCIAGGIVYTLSVYFSFVTELAMVLAMLMTLFLRFSAIKWKITLHVFKYPD